MDINKDKIIEDIKENDRNQIISESDLDLYHLLDTTLPKENTGRFSTGFSKNIIRKIGTKQQRRFNVQIYFLIFFLLMVSCPLFIGFFSENMLQALSSQFLNHKFLVVFVLAIITITAQTSRIRTAKYN